MGGTEVFSNFLEVKEMRKLGLCSAIVLLVGASNAMALTADLNNSVGGASSIQILGSDFGGVGGQLDLTIDLTREGGDPTLTGLQTDFIADAAGLSIIGMQPAGNRSNTGTGTRYNDPEWDAGNSGSISPDDFDGPMSANVAVGTMATGYNQNFVDGIAQWNTPTSLYGHLVISYSAQLAGTIINISPTNVLGVKWEDFDNFEGTGQAFTLEFIVPEPASALLLLAGLPFMRRRRTA